MDEPKKQTPIEVYESLSKPPKTALKEIKGGRLTGMTDVKPQWRIEILTEKFGICGIGWKFTIDKLWQEHGACDEIFAFSQVSLYIKQDDKWSDPIPGTGGSMLVADEKNGLHSNDEAYKMATTDALSVAMKFLGVAASIYMGEWDGSKYKEDNTESKTETTIKELFGNDPKAEEDNRQLEVGQEVPKAYWNLPPEDKRKIMPSGAKATKVDGKWIVLK